MEEKSRVINVFVDSGCRTSVIGRSLLGSLPESAKKEIPMVRKTFVFGNGARCTSNTGVRLLGSMFYVLPCETP